MREAFIVCRDSVENGRSFFDGYEEVGNATYPYFDCILPSASWWFDSLTDLRLLETLAYLGEYGTSEEPLCVLRLVPSDLYPGDWVIEGESEYHAL